MDQAQKMGKIFTYSFEYFPYFSVKNEIIIVHLDEYGEQRMYKVNRNTAGALVVHANKQRFIFTGVKKRHEGHILAFHSLAHKAVLTTDASAELEQSDSDRLVEILLGRHHETVSKLGGNIAEEMAVIVFRWIVAGTPAAVQIAHEYNKRYSA